MKIEGKYNYSAIYCLKNTIDDKCYVGSAKKLNYRLWNHKHKLIRGTHANKHLQNFVNKYGIDSIYFEVLEKVDTNIIEREQYWIDTLKPTFNILPIAGSSEGIVLTEEHKSKISKGRKGILHTEEVKKRISESMIGVPKSKEHSTKVGLKHKGKVVNEEQRNKISQANRGKIATSKLTWDIVNNIRELNKQGYRDKQIVEMFNITKAQACNIRNFKSWK